MPDDHRFHMHAGPVVISSMRLPRILDIVEAIIGGNPIQAQYNR